MDNWIKSPWFTRIVSLFLAILLYTTVAIDEANTSRSNDIFLPTGSSDVETMENVPLHVDLEEEDYVVRGVPDTVNVTVEGPRSVITQTVRQRNFDVFVDLNELGTGQHEVEVTHSGISSQLSVYIEPRTVEVTIEERSTVSFPVEVDFYGRDEDEGEFDEFTGEPEVAPEEVEVTGSNAEVDRIAMVKAFVSFSELAQEGEVSDAPIRVYDAEGNELNVYVDPSTVNVEADVSVNEKRYPLTFETVGELDDDLVLQGIDLNPVSATLFGSIERLGEINILDPIEIDLSEIEESTVLEFDLPVPPDISRVDPEIVEVEVVVEEAVEETWEDVEVEVENLNDDQELTFIEPEDPLVDVQLIGTQSDLDDLAQEDIRVWIDVDGQVEGEFYANVQLDGPEDVRLSSEQERIRVRIE
ncbi:CdaR family protein [Alkalibacillus silvisoli]|uniref:YbbR-like domain-containing protein n=1 Tax=Alkalibacillus silvisoli TaxID=392823 RepID=A0ABN0ZZ79_9BACI